MQPENQLQSIQCGGSSFFLDISLLPFVPYFHDVHPLSIEALRTLLQMTNHTFRPLLCSAEEASLLGPPSWTIMARSLPLFINANLHNKIYCSQTTTHPQTGPLAQYILLGLSSLQYLLTKVIIKKKKKILKKIKLKIYKINHTRGESDNPMLWAQGNTKDIRYQCVYQ